MKKVLRKVLIASLPFLMIFGISIILHLLSFEGNFHRIINGGDIDYPINVWLEIKRSFSVWSGESLGVPEFFAISKLFLSLPQALLQAITGSIYITNFIYFSLLHASAGIFMYVLLRYLKFKPFAVWVGALFFMLNMYVFLRFQFPQPHLRYAYAALPLLIYITARTFNKSIRLYYGIGLFALVMMAVSRTANMYLLYWGLVPFIVFVLSRMKLVEIKIRFKDFILFYSISLLLNLVVIFSYLGLRLNYSDLSENSLLEFYRQDAIRFAKDYRLHETLAGFGSYAWTHQLSDINPGDHNFPILKYYSRITMLAIGSIPIIVALISTIWNLKKRWMLFVLMILFGILANGFGQPFGTIYEATLAKLPLYSDFFRDSWTYWSMPYFFIVAILLALAFNKSFKLKEALKFSSNNFVFAITRVQIAIFLMISAILLYVAPGKMINPAWISEVPYGYQETADYLNKNAQGERVLPLPFSHHIYGYTYYDWGYAGPDIMHRLADVGYTDKHFNQIAGNKTIDMLDGVTEPDPDELNQFLYRTQTNWILLRKDFIDKPGDGSKNRVDQFKQILDNFDCWKIVSEYEDLTLYENQCGDFTRENIEISNDYVYGGNECAAGIPIDYFEEGFPICGRNPKNRNFSIENNRLVIENGRNTDVIDLEDETHDLIANYNFKNGVWNDGDTYTCDPDDPDARTIITRSQSDSEGMKVTSVEQKVCIFEPILNENIGSGAVLKISYTATNPTKVRYCIFGLSDSYCYFNGTFAEDLLQDGIIVKSEEKNGVITDYIFIEDMYKYRYKDDLYLYLYFNDEQSADFEIDLKEVRLVSTPLGYRNILLNSRNALNGDLDLAISNSILGSNVELKNDPEGDYVFSFNQNKNSQWRLYGMKGKDIDREIDQEITTYEYANGWFVEDIEKYDSFLLLYIPQVIFIVGLGLTGWVYVMYLFVWLGGKFVGRG